MAVRPRRVGDAAARSAERAHPEAATGCPGTAVQQPLDAATAQARALAQNDELNAKMRAKSIESGIPFSHLEAAAGMIPADLPQELYDRMAAVRLSAISSAERREMDAAARIARWRDSS